MCSPFQFKNLFDIMRIIYKDMDLYISWDVLEVQCIDLKFSFLFFAFEIIKGFSTNTIYLVSFKLSVVPLLKIMSVKYKL